MPESALLAPAPAPWTGPHLASPACDVDVVIPVYDEEAALEQSIHRLHRFLSESFPFGWRIVIADNASTDRTPDVAHALRAKLRGVEYMRLERKGRGRALRAAWSRSDARVVCYMDVYRVAA
jgi:glycosyltransferase involved in cell wall biosynthesis